MTEDRVRSVVLEGPGRVAVREIPIPVIPGEIEYVGMRAVGICGSDVRYYRGENPWALHTLGRNEPSPPNMVLGHEVSGVAEREGRLVPVAILAYRSCGECEACRAGAENLCANMEHFGHSAGWGEMPYYPGGMSERFTIWKGFAYELPDGVSFEAATFLDGLAVALHALDVGSLAPGKRVGVIGLGPIGMLAAQAAQALGAATVAGCDISPLPVAISRRLGFGAVVHGSPTELAQESRSRSDAGIDLVLDTVGTDESVSAGLGMLAPGGVLVLLAVHEGSLSVAGTAMSGERTITTSSNNRYADFPRAIELLASQAVETAPLITHRFPLSDAPEAFRLLDEPTEPAFKVIITP